MHDTWHATKILLAAAREYDSSHARGGDVVAAAYRLAATKLREHGSDLHAQNLERAAAQAEKTS